MLNAKLQRLLKTPYFWCDPEFYPDVVSYCEQQRIAEPERIEYTIYDDADDIIERAMIFNFEDDFERAMFRVWAAPSFYGPCSGPALEGLDSDFHRKHDDEY